MAKIHLRQATVFGNIPKFTYSPWPITKNKVQIFKKTGDSMYIYRNERDKSCFQPVMADGYFNIYLEKQLLIKYCVIRHLKLLRIQNIMNI